MSIIVYATSIGVLGNEIEAVEELTSIDMPATAAIERQRRLKERNRRSGARMGAHPKKDGRGRT